MTIFEDCGHFITHDKPEETVKSLINFIDHHSQRKMTKRENIPKKSQKITTNFTTKHELSNSTSNTNDQLKASHQFENKKRKRKNSRFFNSNRKNKKR